MSSVVGVAVVVALLAAVSGTAEAQGRPAGDGRIWVELGLAASQQAGRCVGCIGNVTTGGASTSAAVGVTLQRGLGVAVLGRAFQELSFESSLSSRYFVVLAQYSLASVPILSLNAGAGWARHSSEFASDPGNGSGAVLYAGTALRLPSRSTFALTLVADVLKSIEGSPSSHPRLFSVGLAIGAATKSQPFRE